MAAIVRWEESPATAVSVEAIMLVFRPRSSFKAPLFSVIAFFAAWGCGGEDSGLSFDEGPDAGADASQEAGDMPEGGPDASEDSGAGGQGGSDGGNSGGCTTAADCNDGIACTVDVCVKGACSHYPGPNSGATACPDREHCEVGKGCVQGIACASDAQCEVKFGDDACKTNIRCDSANAICVFSILDRDGDGHVPLVCGGDDCNDADNEVHGGAPEICDGKDNDCNGAIDDDAICPGAAVCQAGQCVCPPANRCGAVCVDKSRDSLHCGDCNKACESGKSCEGGSCVCPATSVTCNGICVNPDNNRQHCGACNKACQFGQACEEGKCVQKPCTPPAMYVLQDQSGSMAGTSWSIAKSGISAFMQQGDTLGMNMGIRIFPTNYASGLNDCLAASYETPTVPIGSIPGNTSAINAALPTDPDGGGSVLTAPLQAGVKYVSAWANANPQSKAAIVVVFDNAPNLCTGDTVNTAVSAAASALSASPSVKTYVIGLGADPKANPSVWNQVAQAGGTGSAFVVESAAAMTVALASIRDDLATCP